MEEKPPWLFVNFRHNIKVIEAEKVAPDGKIVPRGELWLCSISTGDGVVHRFSKAQIRIWDRNMIALPEGFWWSGLLGPDSQHSGWALTFSPQKTHSIIFRIPEKYISYIYDMANRAYIYQVLPPNPPLPPPR